MSEQKWCYAVPWEGRLKCIMDYKNKKKQELEKQYCCHLSQGKSKETCEYYLVAKKYR